MPLGLLWRARAFMLLSFSFIVLAIVLTPRFAFADGGNIISFGPLFGFLQPFVDALVTGVITVLVGWVLYVIKQKTSISIDDSMRDAFLTWAKGQASSLVADGAVKVSGLQVSVQSSALAVAANTIFKLIPDATAHFGITPELAAQKIVDMIPHVPTVAATTQAQAAAAVAKG